MRKYKEKPSKEFSILTLDDDEIITSTIQAYFQRSGYMVDVECDPLRAIEKIRNNHYDILLLDFLMTPICGDQVVEEIRKFNKELYIILLTGHKSMAPPIKTIRELDIQGYYEKSERFDQLELLVESCAKSIRQMRTIQAYKNGLSMIVDALPEIYQLDEKGAVLDAGLQTAMDTFGSDGAFVSVTLPYMSSDERVLRKTGAITEEDLESLQIEIPTDETKAWIQGNHLIGSIENEKHDRIGRIVIKCKKKPEEMQVQMLEIFVQQLSASIHNSQMHRLVTKAYGQLNDSYVEIISAMRMIVDERDIYTRGHSDRVSDLATAISKQMGKDEKFIERVKVAGLFHDIGKVGISDNILLKPSKLNDQEYQAIQKHPDKGAKILSALTMFEDVVPIVKHHHERVDGRGYPDGLKSEEIPEEARIIAVADSFDAMTSTRQYRSHMSLEYAISEIKNGSGSQFDSNVVQAFLSLLNSMEEKEFMQQYASDSSKEE